MELNETWRKIDVSKLAYNQRGELLCEMRKASIEVRWWQELVRASQGAGFQETYPADNPYIVYLENELNRQRVRTLLGKWLPAHDIDTQKTSEVKKLAKVTDAILHGDIVPSYLPHNQMAKRPYLSVGAIKAQLELQKPVIFEYDTNVEEAERAEALKPYRLERECTILPYDGMVILVDKSDEETKLSDPMREIKQTAHGWYLGFYMYGGEYHPVIIDPKRKTSWRADRVSSLHANLYEAEEDGLIWRFRGNLTLVPQQTSLYAGIRYHQYSYGRRLLYGEGIDCYGPYYEVCKPWGHNFLFMYAAGQAPVLANKNTRITLQSSGTTRINGVEYLTSTDGTLIGENGRVYVPLTQYYPLYITEQNGQMIICGRDLEELYRCDDLLETNYTKCMVLLDGQKYTLHYGDYILKGYLECYINVTRQKATYRHNDCI